MLRAKVAALRAKVAALRAKVAAMVTDTSARLRVSRPGLTRNRRCMHGQTFVAQIHDQRLVVEYERVGFPAAVQPRLLNRETRLVAANPRHFPGDQHRAVEQETRLRGLDHVETALVQPVLGRQARAGLSALVDTIRAST